VKHTLYTIIGIILFCLAGCTPADFDAAKANQTWTGTCDVGEVGWEIDYDKKWDKTTFSLWVADGDCEFD